MDSSRGRYARVCVEVDLKKPLVPQFILNDDIQRVKDEGFHLILYALSVGKNRMELCPKQNQTDGEDSPAAEEVAEKEGGGHGCSPKPGSASRVGRKAFRTLDANSQQTSQEESATW